MKKRLGLSLIVITSLGLLTFQAFRNPLGAVLAQNLPSAARAIGVDASKANIPIDDILSGGPPPQGIPALGFLGDWQNAAGPSPEPVFVSQEEATEWLKEDEPVIAFTANGEAKAYPLQILTWHEIVNDTVGGQPVAVTFCPLCNSALAFDRRIPLTSQTAQEVTGLNSAAQFIDLGADFLEAYTLQEGSDTGVQSGLEVSFGVSGMLYNSNMLMFDTHTSTLYSQLLGTGNVGTLSNTNLLRLPAQIVSFAEFRAAFPNAPVLSRDTGFSRRYGSNPYVGYDDIGSPAFLFNGITDGRLSAKERIVSVELLGESAAYPFTLLAEQSVINDTIANQAITVFWQQGTASALDGSSIAGSKDVGAVGVFSRNLNGQTLEFSWNGERFIDEQTNSSWNLLGQAVSGELAGSSLEPVVHDNTLWFAWAAFKPETRVYLGD